MSTVEKVEFNIVTPRITEVAFADLTLPEDDQILLARGVTMDDLRYAQPAGLPYLPSRFQSFTREVSPWHWDGMYAAVHLTEVSSCRAQFAGLAKLALRSFKIHDHIEELNAASAEYETEPGDVLVFHGMHGTYDHTVMLHQFTAKHMPRRAYAFPIAIR